MEQLIKGIREKARFALTDTEYNKVNNYLQLKAWTNLRLYISELSEEYEIRQMLDQNRVEEWIAIDEIGDLVMELVVTKIDDVNEGKQRRKRLVRT